MLINVSNVPVSVIRDSFIHFWYIHKYLFNTYLFPPQFILSKTNRMILLKCNVNHMTSAFKTLMCFHHIQRMSLSYDSIFHGPSHSGSLLLCLLLISLNNFVPVKPDFPFSPSNTNSRFIHLLFSLLGICFPVIFQVFAQIILCQGRTFPVYTI